MDKIRNFLTASSVYIILLSLMGFTAHAAEGALDPPGSAHLAQTMECEWRILNNQPDPNDVLVQLAKSLEYDPVKIYNWVHRYIAYEDYYWDSRLGSRMTYQNRRGNSWDTSSLLITLLRISGIPARYVQYSYNSTNYAYVEAWLPLDNYRGIGPGDEEGWVALAPWFKNPAFISGINLFPADGSVPSDLSFDFDEYLKTINYKTPIELYEEKLQTYLSDNYPGKTLKDIPFKQEIIPQNASILPSSLPKNFPSSTLTWFSEVPWERRVSITLYFDLGTQDIQSNITYTKLLERKIYLPMVAGKRFCLDFIPATEADRALIAQKGGMCKQEAIDTGAMVKPVLKLDGIIMPQQNINGQTIPEAVGNPVTLGKSIYLRYVGGGFNMGSKEYRPAKLAGFFMQIGLDPLAASEETISRIKKELVNLPTSLAYSDDTREAYLGRMSYILTETFLLRLFETGSKAEKLLYGKVSRYYLSPTWIFTFPFDIIKNKESKFFIHPQWEIDAQMMGDFYRPDVNNKLVTVLPDKEINKLYMRLLGYSASYNEGRIFEDWFDTQGLSTVKGTMVAYKDNIEVKTVTNTPIDISYLNTLRYAFNLNPNSISDADWSRIRDRLVKDGRINGSTTWSSLKTSFLNNTYKLNIIDSILSEFGIIPGDCLLDSDIQGIISEVTGGKTVKFPVKKINYEGMKGTVRFTEKITQSTYAYGYLFNMNNGGKNSTQVVPSQNHTTEQIVDGWFNKTYTVSVPDLKTNQTTQISYNLTNNQKNSKTYSLGDPVDMVKGEFYQEENPDFEIKSLGFDLSVKRKYKSQLTFNGPFGYGWTWNHAQRIVPAEGGKILYYNEESEAMTLTDLGNGSYDYPPGSLFILQKVNDQNGTYLVTDKKTLIKSYFSSAGLLLKKVDPFGNFLKFYYADKDRMTEIQDSLGRKLSFTYNANGKIEKVTDYAGRYCEYLYTGDDLVTFIDLEGKITRYEYLSNQENVFNNHNMNKYTLPNGDWLEIGYYLNDTAAYHTNKKGETFNFQYSNLNRYGETWNEEGYYRKVFYNENNDVIRVANEDNTIEQMEYDSQHNQVSRTDGNGYKTVFQYYPDGTAEAQKAAFAKDRKLFAKTDAMGNTWGYKYESAANPYTPTEITDPEGNVTRFVYNENSSLAQKKQAPGYEHDPEGRLIINAGSPGLVTTYTYDAKGNITNISFPDNSFIVNTYDANGLYLISKNQNGHIETYEYYDGVQPDWLPLGMMKSRSLVLADSSKLTTRFDYNLYNRLTKEINPLGETTVLKYDDNRKLKEKIEPSGAKTVFEYDSARDIVAGAKPVKMTDPEGFVESYQHDKVGNLTAKTDKNGNTTEYVYDGMNRLISQVDPLGGAVWTRYDGAGNVVGKTDKKGYTTFLEYDKAGRPVKIITPEGKKENYAQTIGYDKNGNKTLETDADGVKTKYEYDALGRVIFKTSGYGSSRPRTFEYRYDAANRLVREIFPEGNFTCFEYDINGNLTARKSYDKDEVTLLNETRFEYYNDVRSLLEKEIIKDGHEVDGAAADIVKEYKYDALGRKTAYIDPEGNITRYAYDKAGNLIRETDPAGNITTYAYDLNKRRTSTTNALGHTQTNQYDGTGNIIVSVDAMGNQTRYFYDAENKKTGMADALGKTTTFDYDVNGNLVATTDQRGNITRVEYDLDNRPVKKIDALKNATATTYSPSGKPVLITAANSVSTRMVYDDPLGKPTKIIQAEGNAEQAVTEFVYDDNGNLEQETNAVGICTSYIYDGLGRMTAKRTGLKSDNTPTFPAGVTNAVIESYTYYPTGNQKTVTDPNNYLTSFEYDGRGNKIKQVDPMGQITAWDYDGNSNVLSARHPGNLTDTYQYDRVNRVIAKTEQGVETRFTYNANNQVTSRTNGESVETTYAYDGLNRLVKKTEGLNTPEEAVSSFGYDSNSNMVYVTNALGKTVFYQYDVLNRRTLETKAQDADASLMDPDKINYAGYTAFKTVTYDAVSNVTAVKKADNISVTYVYDTMERVTQVKHNGSLRQEFAYDTLSRMTRSLDNNSGRSTQEVFYQNYNLLNIAEREIQNGRTVDTTHDGNGNQTRIIYPSGKTIDRTFNPDNLLTSVTSQGLTLAQMTAYNSLGSLKQMTLGNGVSLTIDYDADNKEISRRYTGSGNLYTHDIQNRDNEGNILSEQITGPKGQVQKSYSLDALDRILTASATNKPLAYWTYDLEGNWTVTNQNGPEETRTTNPDNQYTSITPGQVPTYDLNGNTTLPQAGKTLEYDWANRLVRVLMWGSLKLDYYYDAQNRRVKIKDQTSSPVATIEYVYNGDQVIEEYKNTVLDKTFVYAAYIDDPIAMTKGGSTYYYIKDRQYSVRVVTDSSGAIVESYDYSPFGLMKIYNAAGTDITATGSAIGNPFGYTGRTWDAYTGLWNYRNRMYSPSLGRFLQKDPAGYVDGLNLYAYVLNNPLMYVDPMGLTSWRNERTDSSYNVNQSSVVRSAATPIPKVTTEPELFSSHAVTTKMNNDYLISRTNSSTMNATNQVNETLVSTKNCLGVSNEAYQNYLANMKSGGIDINLDKLENVNSAVTIGALAGLLYPPTTIPSAYVLTGSTLAGIGIDTAQYAKNKTPENFKDLVLNVATSAVTYGTGKAVTKTVGLGVEYLPNAKRAYQVMQETKMYRFVPNSLVKKGYQVENLFSSGINTLGQTLMQSHNSTTQRKEN